MRRRREVSIFSFAFLDILATTIGVLIFLLLLAAVDQSGIAEAQKLEQMLVHARTRSASAQQQVRQAEQELAQKRAAARAAQRELSNLARPTPRASAGELLTKERARCRLQSQELERKIDAAKQRLERANKNVASHQAALNNAHGRGQTRHLPEAVGGADTIAVHVDCRKDSLVILGAQPGAWAAPRQTCPKDALASSTSPYQKLIAQVKQSQAQPKGKLSIVLWVRPDGIGAADKALALALRQGVPIGLEPADADWKL